MIISLYFVFEMLRGCWSYQWTVISYFSNRFILLLPLYKIKNFSRIRKNGNTFGKVQTDMKILKKKINYSFLLLCRFASSTYIHINECKDVSKQVLFHIWIIYKDIVRETFKLWFWKLIREMAWKVWFEYINLAFIWYIEYSRARNVRNVLLNDFS